MRFLPTKVHGALDYLVGVALILAPTVFGFSSAGGAAAWLPRVLGVGLILYSIFTRYEWGVVKVLPMGYHLVVDFIAAALLTASPFLFGFTHQGLHVWLPHVVVGVAVIAVVLVSKTKPGSSVTAEVAWNETSEAEAVAPAAWQPAPVAQASGPAAAVPYSSTGRAAWMPGATEADRRAEMAALRGGVRSNPAA